jgi:hypothetical protein
MDIDVDTDVSNDASDTSNHIEFLGNDRFTTAFNCINVETVRLVDGSDLVDDSDSDNDSVYEYSTINNRTNTMKFIGSRYMNCETVPIVIIKGNNC